MVAFRNRHDRFGRFTKTQTQDLEMGEIRGIKNIPSAPFSGGHDNSFNRRSAGRV